MNDMSIDTSPNLYLKHSEDGTMLAMLEKPIRRINYWVDLIFRVSENREIIGRGWERQDIKSEWQDNKLNPTLVKNI